MVYLDVFKVSPQMTGSEYITRVFIGGRKSPKGLQMLKMKEICSGAAGVLWQMEAQRISSPCVPVFMKCR